MNRLLALIAITLFTAIAFTRADSPAATPTAPAAPATQATLQKMTWKVGDITREALVYLPPKSDKNPPIIFAFHGHGGTSRFAARKFAFHTLWPEAIVVYPQGLPTPSQLVDPQGKFPGWQKTAGDQGDRDLNFYDAMLKTFKTDYHVDAKQIFVTGHSNGGIFTYVLWAARGDEIAAVAPIAAILDVKDLKKMKPKPVLHVAGEKDPLVKFEWQQRTIEADEKINGTDPEGKPAGEHCTEYSSKDGPPVIAYIHPGGHEVPDGAPKRIIQFFKENPGK